MFRRDGSIVTSSSSSNTIGTRIFHEEYFAFLKKHGAHFDEKYLWELAAPDHPVPYGTVLPRDAFPGTSYQATIGVVPPGRAFSTFTSGAPGVFLEGARSSAL
jgi:hypothetical protein